MDQFIESCEKSEEIKFILLHLFTFQTPILSKM